MATNTIATYLTSIFLLAAAGCGPTSVEEEAIDEAEQAATACVTIQRGAGSSVVKDTYLHQGLPTTSFGASGDMYSGVHSSGALQRAMVQFDLSSIPAGATIASAEMTVTVTYAESAAETVRVRRVTSDWAEGTATWSTHGSAYDQSSVEASFAAGSGARTVGIAPLVQAWVSGATPNYGVLLEQTAKRTQMKTSDDATQARRPQLVVCYDEPAASTSSSSGGAGGAPGGAGGAPGEGGAGGEAGEGGSGGAPGEGGGGSGIPDAGISPAGAQSTYGCEPGGALAGKVYYFVDAGAPAGGTGTRSAPFKAAQDGFLAVQNGQKAVICVAAGTYLEHVGNSADRFSSGTEYALVGGFQPGSGFSVRNSLAHTTTLRAPSTSAPALRFGNLKSITVDGFAITGGLHGLLISSGYSEGRTLVVRNNHVFGNGVEGLAGHQGAGMKVSGGQIVIEHNLIEGNAGGQGGAGIYISSPSSSERNTKTGGALTVGSALATISRNIVRDNVLRHDTPHGVGIAVSINALIDHNVVTGNRGYKLLSGSGGEAVGGGIFSQLQYSTVTISNNWVEDNQALKAGSGIFVDEGTIGTVINNVVIGNQGEGAITVDGRASGSNAEDRSYATIVNNTVAGNSNGAMFIQDATVHVFNNLFWGNGPVDLSVHLGGALPEVIVADYNLFAGTYSGSAFQLGSHNLSGVAPAFADAQEGDYRLLASSPMIDAGVASFAPAFAYSGALTTAPGADLDGAPRPQGAGIDLGAFER